MSTVLVVDDKDLLRDSVAATLQRAGFTVIAAADGPQAVELAAERRPDAVVTDLKMPGMTGIELIEKLIELDADMPVVLMTAFATVETAVDAMKQGAYDYITKPFQGDELIIAVKRAIEHARIRRENTVLKLSPTEPSAPINPASASGERTPLRQRTGLDRLVGDCQTLAEIKGKVKTIAASHATVLVTGESGAGKEVAARAVHELSPRAGEPFLAVNCAAMSESLLESELFGHEKGSFTGADKTRKGRFELAHRGTLLLDEISEIRPSLQAKLLRVLQERTFERVGSSTAITIDVRIIATSNRDLLKEVEAGRFRQDLYYRLNVLPIQLPALRERPGDVRQLAPHFVAMACAREGRQPLEISDEALDLLSSYSWPGNVRELQNLCERAVVLCAHDRIEAPLIRPWLGLATPKRAASPVSMQPSATTRPVGTNGNGSPSPFQNGQAAAPVSHPQQPRGWFTNGEVKPLAEVEREIIVETLTRFNGHRQKTAHALGIGVRTLGLKLKKWKEERIVPESL